MRLRTSFLLTALALLGSACSHAPEPALSHLPEPALSDLPDLFDYKVDPYIRMAVALQSMDRSAALNKLHAGVRKGSIRVIVLARMLFVPRPGADLERPEGVLAHAIDETRHWPQWPIEVVDGVPFLIAMPDQELHVKWVPDAEENYLQYCETHGDWSPFHYSVKTTLQKYEALTKLIFGQSLESEVMFLKAQIE